MRLTELSILVGRVLNERDGLSSEIVMDLRCVKILNAHRSWVDGTNGSNGISLDTANQSVHKVFELEDLVKSTCNVRHGGRDDLILSAIQAK